MDLSTASAIETSMVKSEMSTISESANERSSWWMYVTTITAFVIITMFCCVVLLITIIASDSKDTTTFDEDIDVSGGSGGYETTTTTEGPRERVTRKIPPRDEPVTTRGMITFPPVTRAPETPTPSPVTMRPTEAPTTTPTTPTAPTAVPQAEEAPAGTLVCTVSNLMSPNKSSLPPDGVCDLLFFESFYKDDKNILSGGYSALEQNARFFVDQAASAKKTEYGASFMFTNTTSRAQYMTDKFYPAIKELWSRNVHHYGFLNLYREFSTPRVVTDALLVLKQLYSDLKRDGLQRQAFFVLGLSIELAEDHGTVGLMETIFVPSMFIAIGHISYSDASFPHCSILPPTIQRFPAFYDIHYGHKLEDILPMLQLVRNSHPHMPLFLSVTLSGRYYAPKLALEDTPDRYNPFEDCKDFSGPRYDDPVNLCPSVAGPDWITEISFFYQYKAVVNEVLKRTFTYDTVDTIQPKVCDAKSKLKDVSFGVAVYDVDFDSSPEGCKELSIQPGAFNRLYLVRPLSNFLLRSFTGHLDCRHMNFTARQAP